MFVKLPIQLIKCCTALLLAERVITTFFMLQVASLDQLHPLIVVVVCMKRLAGKRHWPFAVVGSVILVDALCCTTHANKNVA